MVLYIGTVLVRVSIPAQTSWPRSKLGRKGFIHLTLSTMLLITKGCQDWNSSRSGSRSWCRGHGEMLFTGLLPLACSACSLIEPKTTSPGMVPPARGLSSLITNWENAPQLDLMEAFPHLKLLSWVNSSLCQVDTQNQPVPRWTNINKLHCLKISL